MGKISYICRTVLAGVMLAGLGYGAVAQEPETKVSGKVVYTVTPLAGSALAGGKRLNRGHLKGVILTDEPVVLFHLNAQDCLGSSLVDGSGKEIEGSGGCTASDRDGDTWSLWYHNTPGARTWSVISGTGKYEGMTGGGSTTPLSATADGRFAVSFGGMIKLK